MRYSSLPAVTTATVRQQGPPGNHRACDAWTIPSDSVQKMPFLGALLHEKQDGLLAPRRRRLACSAQASRRLRPPIPPGLPRALSDLRLPRGGLVALPTPQGCRGPLHLRARPEPRLIFTRLCFQLLSVCPGTLFWHAYWIWTGSTAVPTKNTNVLH